MVNFNPVELFLSYSIIGAMIVLPVVLLIVAIIIVVIVKRKGDIAEKQSRNRATKKQKNYRSENS